MYDSQLLTPIIWNPSRLYMKFNSSPLDKMAAIL